MSVTRPTSSRTSVVMELCRSPRSADVGSADVRQGRRDRRRRPVSATPICLASRAQRGGMASGSRIRIAHSVRCRSITSTGRSSPRLPVLFGRLTIVAPHRFSVYSSVVRDLVARHECTWISMVPSSPIWPEPTRDFSLITIRPVGLRAPAARAAPRLRGTLAFRHRGDGHDGIASIVFCKPA